MARIQTAEWRSAYLAAVLEVDDASLAARIENAEAAISRRLQSDGNLDLDECQRLFDAIRGLHVLRSERLRMVPRTAGTTARTSSGSQEASMAKLPLQHPEWEWVAKYRYAFLELDDARLIEKMEEAEAVIYSRVQAMNGTAKADERRALANAIRALQVLRQERLGHRR